jgi:hypothetical protein
MAEVGAASACKQLARSLRPWPVNLRQAASFCWHVLECLATLLPCCWPPQAAESGMNAPVPPPECIAQYHLRGKKAGSGGLGVVYPAQHAPSGHQVALKLGNAFDSADGPRWEASRRGTLAAVPYCLMQFPAHTSGAMPALAASGVPRWHGHMNALCHCSLHL